eukprot:1424688-Rhodomonas_salina.4
MFVTHYFVEDVISPCASWGFGASWQHDDVPRGCAQCEMRTLNAIKRLEWTNCARSPFLVFFAFSISPLRSRIPASISSQPAFAR